MPFQCACFISYPHNAGKSVDRFVTRLKQELEDRVAQYVTDPVESDHDYPTGIDYHKRIARRICASACLIVVYMPVYQRKPFCLQEYTAMERLQAHRLQRLKKDLSPTCGMIVPLVYTGVEQKIPQWISQRINYKDISKFTVSDPELVFGQADFQAWLGSMADMIDTISRDFIRTRTSSPGSTR